ncbi:DUF1134 domain-containing protein [Novosphingobium mangrovi (ex Huang et al. 2023)]|uniref:DUF1134 domain-containing protein n=1 Tax=Novosphingobium mangrovi (ex Huang et al. 2023) TaxID=2976432 RepID=A0ABT2I1K1_9SPHN|nr:DUF1134 domain-containing protein [Novosphingobium mangrovi (ex Huang et al. 2023)]MCT2398692.1 DUF1134 domain-containing protein [Novosphingobium mangrovi (ex Huang et al. 2023)]
MPVSTHERGKGRRRLHRPIVALAAALLAVIAPVAPALAQVTTVDPDAAIDADLNQGTTFSQQPTGELPSSEPTAPAAADSTPAQSGGGVADWNANAVSAPAPAATAGAQTADSTSTYREDDLIGAAEGVFGKGAKGLADLIKDLLAKQGEPNAYIVGREAGGAFAVGLRYGSGTLHHKVEGEQPVYWTGPSIGFDAGANAGNAFVLVYNLYDSEDLYHRFGAGEGQAYLVGGFTVSYLRRGDVVLIPVRAGAGLRLGANIGYMKFSHKQKWLPF